MNVDFRTIHNHTVRTKNDRERFIRAQMESSLSAVAMLTKLCSRKNNGKKKFSPEFCFDEKMKKVSQDTQILMNILSSDQLDKEEAKRCLSEISLIASDAEKEISNASLREDYEWIIRILDMTIESLSI